MLCICVRVCVALREIVGGGLDLGISLLVVGVRVCMCV